MRTFRASLTDPEITVESDIYDFDVLIGDPSLGICVGEYGMPKFCSGLTGAEQFARRLLDYIEKNRANLDHAFAAMRGGEHG